MTVNTKTPKPPMSDKETHKTLINRLDRLAQLAEGRALFHADTLRNLHNERGELRTRIDELQQDLDIVDAKIIQQAGLRASADRITQSVNGYLVSLNRQIA